MLEPQKAEDAPTTMIVGTAARPSTVSTPDSPRASDQDISVGSRRAALGRAVSFRNVGAIYIMIALLVLFSVWIPQNFLTAGVWKTLIDDQALTAMVALGAMIPLAAGVFDLAIGTEVGFAGILAAWLLVNHHVPTIPAVLLTLLAGAVVGAGSGLLIVKARIDSFIATLGMSSVLAALTAWLSNGQQILNLPSAFQAIGNDQLLGLTYPVWITLIVAIIIWYVLERTSVGRRIYATGGNSDAARLAGVRTLRIVVFSLVACGMITAAAGLLESAQLGTGDPTVGPSFLLPAIAAVFLGSTQFRGGRVNVWGTVLAVYTLAVGVKGLQLAGAPIWIPDLFNGVALLLAVGLARYEANSGRTGAIRRALRMKSKPVVSSA